MTSDYADLVTRARDVQETLRRTRDPRQRVARVQRALLLAAHIEHAAVLRLLSELEEEAAEVGEVRRALALAKARVVERAARLRNAAPARTLTLAEVVHG